MPIRIPICFLSSFSFFPTLLLFVGETLGIDEGDADIDGSSLGVAEGVAEGDPDGDIDGSALGVADGIAEGDADIVGSPLGVADGIAEGTTDGETEGARLGESEMLGLADLDPFLDPFLDFPFLLLFVGAEVPNTEGARLEDGEAVLLLALVALDFFG
jgi:hypothetical protein